MGDYSERDSSNEGSELPRMDGGRGDAPPIVTSTEKVNNSFSIPEGVTGLS